MSICTGSGGVSSRVGAAGAPSVRAACFSLSLGSLCVEVAPLSQHPGQPGLGGPSSPGPGEPARGPRLGAVSLVHSPAEPQVSGLLYWAPPGSGALCPWPTWGCGRQLDQDRLRVTRRVHHAKVREAQEGLGRYAGHVKPVGPGPRGGREGGFEGRCPPQACSRPPQPPLVHLEPPGPATLRAPEEEGT